MPRKSDAAKAKGKRYTREWFRANRAHRNEYKRARTVSRNGRGVCPRCEGTFALRLDGNVRAHRCPNEVTP